jgi:hypothetical protein
VLFASCEQFYRGCALCAALRCCGRHAAALRRAQVAAKFGRSLSSAQKARMFAWLGTQVGRGR